MKIRKFLAYLAAGAVLATAGCSKEKDISPQVADTPHRLVEEYLCTSQAIGQVSQIVLVKYLDLFKGYEDFAAYFINTLIEMLTYIQKQEFDNPDNAPWHIEQHYFTYRSVLAAGDSATLSGMVAYPMFNDSRQRPPLNGLTIFNDKVKLVDNTGQPGLEVAARAALNQAVVSTDIEGFGVQSDRWVPYFDAFTKGRQSIDAAIAAKELLESKGITFKSDAKTWNFGISLGGHHALGALKYYESDQCPQSVRDVLPDFRTYASICPIDVRNLFMEYTEKDQLEYPFVALMMVSTIFAVFPETQSEYSLEDFLSEDVNTSSVTIDSVTCTITESFRRKLMAGDPLRAVLKEVTGGYMRNILAPDMFDADGTLNPDNPKSQLLLQTMEHVNLSRGWQPGHPTHLIYSPDDIVIYYNSVKNELDRFIDGGATIELEQSFGAHEFAGFMAIYKFLMDRQYR